jgi:hypothetical protein
MTHHTVNVLHLLSFTVITKTQFKKPLDVRDLSPVRGPGDGDSARMRTLPRSCGVTSGHAIR